MTDISKLSTMDEVAAKLRYDVATGIFTWIDSPGRKVGAGSIAGKVRVKDGYRIIKYKGREFYAHRLAWFKVYGREVRQIDHINCHRDDNRFENLREASPRQNRANQKRRSNNTSGFKGVHWSELHKKWRARIKVDGRYKSLGYFDDPKNAFAAYMDAATAAHGPFARAK